ncbi:MAG: hypothetical protein IPF51_07610 [Dehalococcoidia bacterium]|uniref:hypothetical protein n=1 Tax=Candidatus Amarobacter glycogenicus TaxID=3140699 RepID=UPI00313651BC|nr:hypothetical protein [Dehalococcoidia bacterium]
MSARPAPGSPQSTLPTARTAPATLSLAATMRATSGRTARSSSTSPTPGWWNISGRHLQPDRCHERQRNTTAGATVANAVQVTLTATNAMGVAEV